MSSLKLLIFLSSVRQKRNADRVIKLITKLTKDKGFEVDIFDPLKENLPLLKTPLHFYADPSEAPQQIHGLNQKIISAEAYLFITAEYNFGVPPALLNTIDHFPPTSFSFKPAGIISYSIGSGGKVSSSHVLDTLIYLGCMVQPHMINIYNVENSISKEGKSLEDELEGNIQILLDQIEFTGTALKQQKQLGKLKQPRLNNFF